jgi:hypothetical protein
LQTSKDGKPLECTPSLLALTFVAWVETDLAGTRQTLKVLKKHDLDHQGYNAKEEELENILSRFFSFDKETALFRQLCLFYDALWYKLLLPELIAKTDRIPHNSIEAYERL